MRLDDEGIGAAIRNNWVRGKGQSSKLLRILRRDLGIACEQSSISNDLPHSQEYDWSTQMKKASSNKQILVRALRTTQGQGIDVFAFFLFGSDVTRVADISRIERDDGDELKGFQRSEIKSHVKSIVHYLDSEKVLFPNAIILALGNEVEFRQSRGPIPENMVEVAHGGTLTIPVLPEGRRVAWIVDGQQRSLALAKSKNNRIPVPVIAFISPDIETHTESNSFS